MRTDELDFALPPELIAQHPVQNRADSRLLHYRRCDRATAHQRFAELPQLLRSGDLMVFNDARVLPARFSLRKTTGGLIQGLFLGIEADGAWLAMLRNLGPRAGGKTLEFADEPAARATVLQQLPDGHYRLRIHCPMTALELLSRIGRMPLPPYIRRDPRRDDRDDADRERYQTVYARQPGSVAAPTAGLHFTDEIMARLDHAGVLRCFLTLHVGPGTFRPITADTLEEHPMHSEAYSIPPPAADMLNRARRERRRIIAVGTTAARVLESQPEDRPFQATGGQTGIFIHPPYRWKHVGALITNFHLPRSTLIALVAAMVGLEEQRRLYQLAIDQRYRFFSYGDAMLIE
jgi:S-adenosylmethionine:tRNA ribosyltransferase-isomerase